MAQTMAVNAIAPFVICSLLKMSMMPPSPLNDKNEKMNSDNKVNMNANKNKNNEKINNKNTNKNGEKNNKEEENKSRALDLCYSHIVNVTALEGKFNVGKKSGGHPHTVSWTGIFPFFYTFFCTFFDSLFS